MAEALFTVESTFTIKWIGQRPSDPRYGVLVDLDLDVPIGSVVTAERKV